MRLLTYNIHKGIGGHDRRYRLDRVIAVLQAAEPDLVCLQEVTREAPRTNYHDQPKMLADALRLRYRFQMNVHYTRGGYGNMILSRWPLETYHRVALRMNSRKPRAAQLAVIASPHGKFHLVNWHLGLSVIERDWQVRHLLAHSLFKESEHLPTIIAGDANDWRDRLIHGPFETSGFEEVTRPPSRHRSFPAWVSMGSLDKIYTRGPIHIKQVHPIRSAATRRASDHLPVLMEFSIGG